MLVVIVDPKVKEIYDQEANNSGSYTYTFEDKIRLPHGPSVEAILLSLENAMWARWCKGIKVGILVEKVDWSSIQLARQVEAYNIYIKPKNIAELDDIVNKIINSSPTAKTNIFKKTVDNSLSIPKIGNPEETTCYLNLPQEFHELPNYENILEKFCRKHVLSSTQITKIKLLYEELFIICKNNNCTQWQVVLKVKDNEIIVNIINNKKVENKTKAYLPNLQNLYSANSFSFLPEDNCLALNVAS